MIFFVDINSSGFVQIIFAFFIHTAALFVSLNYFKKFKIVYVSIFSAVNILTYAIAPVFVDFKNFQLGEFNPNVLDIFNMGFIFFYATHFFIIHYLHSPTTKHVSLDVNIGRVQLVFFVIYVLDFFVKIEINGIREMIQFYTIGVFLFGFVKRQNHTVQNIFLLVVVLYQSVDAITSGLIYSLVFLFSFLMLCAYVFGGVTGKVQFFGLSFLVLLIGFSTLFSPVKMAYRVENESHNYTMTERVVLISNLIFEDHEILKDNADNVHDGTFWRLTYPLSALSLVYDKTPTFIPFWEGESYVIILYKFIPRFLWKDKPKENMGQIFGHRYSILSLDNLTTSMNTPIITEAYMNFGLIFVFVVFVFMSIIMALLFLKDNLIRGVSGSIQTVLSDIKICIGAVFFLQFESNLSMLLGKIVILTVTSSLMNWLFFRKRS